jgi:hypothetical protein
MLVSLTPALPQGEGAKVAATFTLSYFPALVSAAFGLPKLQLSSA